MLATIEDEGSAEEPEPVRMNVTEKIVGKNESSQSELKGAEKEIRKLKEEVSNAQKGRKSQGAGVKSQAQVEATTVGEETVSHQRCLLIFFLDVIDVLGRRNTYQGKERKYTKDGRSVNNFPVHRSASFEAYRGTGRHLSKRKSSIAVTDDKCQ